MIHQLKSFAQKTKIYDPTNFVLQFFSGRKFKITFPEQKAIFWRNFVLEVEFFTQKMCVIPRLVCRNETDQIVSWL